MLQCGSEPLATSLIPSRDVRKFGNSPMVQCFGNFQLDRKPDAVRLHDCQAGACASACVFVYLRLERKLYHSRPARGRAPRLSENAGVAGREKAVFSMGDRVEAVVFAVVCDPYSSLALAAPSGATASASEG